MLENLANSITNKVRKSFKNKNNAKALIALKQKMKKNNKIYKTEIEEFMKNPISEEEEEEEEEVESSEEE